MNFWSGPNLATKCLLFAAIVIGGSIFVGSTGSPAGNIKTDNFYPPRAAASPMAEFYVATDGNDSGAGTSTDPFQTIYRAQQAVRATIAGTMTGDVIVDLEGGLYILNQTVQFNQSDSGNSGYQVIYRNWTNAAPILSGGQAITGWTPYKNGIWMAPCNIPDFRQLYVNGQRAVRARGEVSKVISADGDGLTFKNWDIGSWKNLQDVEFVFPDVWTMPRIHVNSVSGNRIYMQEPAFSAALTKGGTAITMPAWVENALELLDQPGEWYLDKTAKIVYYMPRTGEDMTTATVVAPVLQTLLAVEGNATQKVANLQFQGLTFAFGTWLEPDQYGVGFVDLQANVHMVYDGLTQVSEMSPGNVITQYAENIAFLNCTFTHLGSTALDLQAGTNQTTVTGNRFVDNSGIAVQIGEVDYPMLDPANPQVVCDIDVIDNYITNCSVEYCGGPGIFTGYVRNVRIEHNTISNLPYDGISVGWGWSATLTVCANNTVKYNRIYGVMTFLADGAGIYTLSTQPGTNVSYNVIHDSGWNGLYPDERTNATTWTYNVVWNSMNSIQNHIMYFNDPIANPYALNNISENYLDEYPTFAVPPHWDTQEGPNQIYGLTPGSAGFPQWIVDLSGVEPAYAWLIPANEWYWHFTKPAVEINPIGNNPVAAWVILLSFAAIIGVGVAILWRTQEKTDLARKAGVFPVEETGGEG